MLVQTINQFENQGWHALVGRHTIKLLSSKSNPRLRLQQYNSQMAFILVLSCILLLANPIAIGHPRHQSQGVPPGRFLLINVG